MEQVTFSELIIPAASAIAGAVIGSVGVFVASLRQARASFVANSRQVWINDLRKTIAEYIAAWQLLVYSRIEKRPADEWTKMFTTVQSLDAQIRMMLNPAEAETIQLEKVLDDGMAFIRTPEADWKKPPFVLQAPLLRVARAIFKAEWEKAKKLK